MNLLDRIKNHFSESYKRRVIEVPEWGDGDQALKLYVDPITLRQKREIKNKMDRKSTFDALAFAIVAYSKDEEGKKLFNLNDEHVFLNSADPDVVIRVGNEILIQGQSLSDDDEEEMQDLEEVKKN